LSGSLSRIWLYAGSLRCASRRTELRLFGGGVQTSTRRPLASPFGGSPARDLRRRLPSVSGARSAPAPCSTRGRRCAPRSALPRPLRMPASASRASSLSGALAALPAATNASAARAFISPTAFEQARGGALGAGGSEAEIRSRTRTVRKEVWEFGACDRNGAHAFLLGRSKHLAGSLEALAGSLEAGGFSAPYAVHTRRSRSPAARAGHPWAQ